MRPAKNAPVWGLFFLWCALCACRSAPEPGSPLPEAAVARLEEAGVPLPREALAHIRPPEAFFPEDLWEDPPWRPVAPGILMLPWDPPGQTPPVFAFKIDLTNPALRLAAYPSPADVDEGGVFPAKKPGVFARESRSALVINATPYTLPGGVLSKKRRLTGVHWAGGAELSPPQARYGALGFYADNRAFTVTAQAQEIPGGARLVLGGFFPILEGGAILGQKTASLDARTAVGVSGDGATLFVLIVKGRGKPLERGMTYEECALVLALLGARDALQLDGGDSVSLVVNGRTLAGNPLRLPGNLLGFGAGD